MVAAVPNVRLVEIALVTDAVRSFLGFLAKILDSVGTVPVSIRSMARFTVIRLSAVLSAGMLFAGCPLFDGSTKPTTSPSPR